MARFTFKLEAVLRHRKSVARDRQRELASQLAAMQKLEADLRELDQAARGAADDLRGGKLLGPLDLAYLAAHRRFVTAMRAKAVALAQKMALQQRKIDEARALLLEAAKQRKIIEKLRERQHQRWLADQSRKEMAQLDEIGMQLAHTLPADDADAGDEP